MPRDWCNVRRRGLTHRKNMFLTNRKQKIKKQETTIYDRKTKIKKQETRIYNRITEKK